MRTLSYNPKHVALNLGRNIEAQAVEIPEKNLVRFRYATENKIANTAFRFEANSYTHSTLVDKISVKRMPAYTLEASRIQTRGLRVVTKPNGYVGIEGSGVYPRTKTELEAGILDVLSATSNFIDNIHPRIMKSLKNLKR